MCIRDSAGRAHPRHLERGTRRAHRDAGHHLHADRRGRLHDCLLYTSDAADERSSVDLGGRRIIKKKQKLLRRTERSQLNISNRH